MQAQIPDPKEAYKQVVEHIVKHAPTKYHWLEATTFFQFHEGLFLIKAPKSLEDQNKTLFFADIVKYLNGTLSEGMQEPCEVAFIFE